MACSSTFHPYGQKKAIRLTDTLFCNFISLSDNDIFRKSLGSFSGCPWYLFIFEVNRNVTRASAPPRLRLMPSCPHASHHRPWCPIRIHPSARMDWDICWAMIFLTKLQRTVCMLSIFFTMQSIHVPFFLFSDATAEWLNPGDCIEICERRATRFSFVLSFATHACTLVWFVYLESYSVVETALTNPWGHFITVVKNQMPWLVRPSSRQPSCMISTTIVAVEPDPFHFEKSLGRAIGIFFHVMLAFAKWIACSNAICVMVPCFRGIL